MLIYYIQPLTFLKLPGDAFLGTDAIGAWINILAVGCEVCDWEFSTCWENTLDIETVCEGPVEIERCVTKLAGCTFTKN